MSGHTRGPWKFIDVIGQCTLWAGSRQLLKYTSPDSENLANARLMASAPDLLEALEELLYAWEQHQNPTDGVADDARKAISCARGESK